MKFCSQCGAARRPSDKFCSSCGTPLAEQASTQLSTPDEQPKETIAPPAGELEGKSTVGDSKPAASGRDDGTSDAPGDRSRKSKALRTSLLAFAAVGVVSAIVAAAFVQDSSGPSSDFESSGPSSDFEDGCWGCTPAQVETMRENREKSEDKETGAASAICESVDRVDELYHSSGTFDELWAEADRLSLRLATADLNPESDLFILAKATSDTLLTINSYLTTAPKTEAEVDDFQFALDTMDSAFDATLNRCERDGFL